MLHSVSACLTDVVLTEYRIWKVKFNNVRCMASLLSGLNYHHEAFSIRVLQRVCFKVLIHGTIRSWTQCLKT